MNTRWGNVEHCWTLVGRRRGQFWYARRLGHTLGELASVEFDAAWALQREESKGDVVGFYHTHPGGPPEPSRRDLRTMRAWAGSFGKPLLCLIESAGKLAAYRFDHDNSAAVVITACELFPRGVVIAFDGEGGATDGE
jgi:proteasome lid subunit RPN8/RPN11